MEPINITFTQGSESRTFTISSEGKPGMTFYEPSQGYFPTFEMALVACGNAARKWFRDS